MKVRALKRLVGSYGMLDKGDCIDLPNYVANQLLASGYVAAVEEDQPSSDEKQIVTPPQKRRGRKDASG